MNSDGKEGVAPEFTVTYTNEALNMSDATYGHYPTQFPVIITVTQRGTVNIPTFGVSGMLRTEAFFCSCKKEYEKHYSELVLAIGSSTKLQLDVIRPVTTSSLVRTGGQKTPDKAGDSTVTDASGKK